MGYIPTKAEQLSVDVGSHFLREVLGSVINVGVDLFQILLHLKGFV